MTKRNETIICWLLLMVSSLPLLALDRLMHTIDIAVDDDRSETLYFAADDDLFERARAFTALHSLTRGGGCSGDEACVVEHIAEQMAAELRVKPRPIMESTKSAHRMLRSEPSESKRIATCVLSPLIMSYAVLWVFNLLCSNVMRRAFKRNC